MRIEFDPAKDERNFRERIVLVGVTSPPDTDDDTEALLDELWSYLVDERNVIEHQWREGDVVLWDNRCSVHQRGPFDPTTERELHATQVRGHRPVEAADARARPLHPRGVFH